MLDLNVKLKVLLFFVFATNSYFLHSTNYYVNDGSLTGDIYCSVIGNNTNSGLSTSTPKKTLKALWLAYGPAGTNVLTAGDIIYIDAGTYARGGADAVTTESKFDINVAGLTFQGAGRTLTIFDNNNYATNTDYFMEINANNISIKDLTITQYESNAPNSGTTYTRGTSSFNTGGQALSIFGCTGVLIENVNIFDNGNGGNGSVGIGPNTGCKFIGGGSNCNATGSSYSGGIDIYGNNVNVDIENYVLAYNSKEGFNGAALMIFGVTASTNVNVKRTVISNNIGGAGGGAIYIDGANARFTDCVIDNNTTTGSWGPNRTGNGVAIVGGTVKLLRSIIQNNLSTTTTDFGGVGLTPSSSAVNLTIDSCLFRGNGGTRTGGKDLGARINSANTFTINVNQTTFASYGANRAIAIGGGSSNSCAGNTFTITNSGNHTIEYSGSPVCSLGAGSNTNNPTYTPNPDVPGFTGPCGTFTLLPVELLEFNASCTSNNVELSWVTISENNNDYFVLQKAGADYKFEDVTRIDGNGSSVQVNTYNYVDQEVTNALTYYKLKQVDFDGQEKTLKTISKNFDCTNGQEKFNVHVNSSEELTLFFEFLKNLNYEINIFDFKGILIENKSLFLDENVFQYNYLLKNSLERGAYIVSLKNEVKTSVYKLIIN